MRVSETPLYTANDIHERITELALDINTALSDSNPAILTVLDGAVPFSKSLRPKLAMPFTSGTVRAKSYTGTLSAGVVEIGMNFDFSIEGRDVLIVEDIVDTGRTADALIRALQKENPASIRMVTLLDKPDRRKIAYQPDWVGFTIEDRFVIGFGMDHNEQYRSLPDIRILEP